MGWALDLDGVVWLGTESIPGVAEAVAAGVGTPDIYPQGGYTTQDVAQAIVSLI